MYWANYHSHTSFCDGHSSMEDFVKSAIEHKIRNYGFSSHAPLPFLTRWTMLKEDFSNYQSEFIRLKNSYINDINLVLGLEVDYIENCTDAHNEFFKDKNLDFIIGSIHYLDKISESEYWCIDGPFQQFDEGLNLLFDGDIRLATQRYFEITNKMIDKGGFNIVGHVDKINMHGLNFKELDHKSEWYRNLLGQTLQKIKEKNLILEINTKSLNTKGFTYPNKQFYSLIKELDIPIVVNSDCHYTTLVVDGFSETYLALKQAGFRYLHQIINGSWVGVEFDENGLKE